MGSSGTYQETAYGRIMKKRPLETEFITVWGKFPESTGMVVVWRTSLELRVFFQIFKESLKMQVQLLPTSDVGSGCSFSCQSFPTLHRRGDVLWFPCQFIQMYLKSMKMHPTAFGSYSIKDPRTWNKQLSPRKKRIESPRPSQSSQLQQAYLRIRVPEGHAVRIARRSEIQWKRPGRAEVRGTMVFQNLHEI